MTGVLNPFSIVIVSIIAVAVILWYKLRYQSLPQKLLRSLRRTEEWKQTPPGAIENNHFSVVVLIDGPAGEKVDFRVVVGKPGIYPTNLPLAEFLVWCWRDKRGWQVVRFNPGASLRILLRTIIIQGGCAWDRGQYLPRWMALKLIEQNIL